MFAWMLGMRKAACTAIKTRAQIASLPHVEVRFLDAGGAPLDVLLMLDSGACGADIMLHARAMSELKLGRLGRCATCDLSSAPACLQRGVFVGVI